ncbi:MAG: hypothetical protein A3D26_01545 [Candidatus Blackburnbacteria bacterium RIFCSPHIGHO2_02_FULL_44_20]|uniref:BioF2-like acetyltransferase domain-containing protein n=1 Tax=Candidatus Blackburnbacteria bacterium RIFCSPHIGHO2_02_FULL_44_20 TaxID=1797516 RepID=A0A1G1V630_9BACT|nr:MAG: hypothetical protein A3D26_01545 [Candidatus Blackburnbacteria bacterium RIFCSPHIGHO2_02_FULL_44_20]OGY10825.1 MAG: hypothetical protein A3E16_04010 [Candidatus Blackburnbacteria bacterium RIFCSPHIGHO2_12_FULL_44_25]
MIDLRQSKEYTKYMHALGWEVLQLNGDRVYLRSIPLLGFIAKMQRPRIIPSPADVRAFCGEHKVRAFYLEPLRAEPQVDGFHRARSSFVPAKTIHVDLTKLEAELLKACKPKTRYNIGLSRRRGIRIENSQDIEKFISMWKKSATERGMWLSQDKEIDALYGAFGKNAELLFAYKDTELLGGVFICYTASAGYYMYAGSTKEGKQLFAPTFLAWEAINSSKKRKKKVFDFEGIYDSRYFSTKTWRGFTKFKEGFGGEVLEYPPTLVYYANPLLKILGL